MFVSTFGETVQMLNEKYAHPSGFHLSLLDMGLFPEELSGSETPHELLTQTYDWRWDEPEKEEYNVKLSAENMRFVGNAIEAYRKTMNELYVEPHLEEIVRKMMGGADVNQ